MQALARLQTAADCLHESSRLSPASVSQVTGALVPQSNGPPAALGTRSASRSPQLLSTTNMPSSFLCDSSFSSLTAAAPVFSSSISCVFGGPPISSNALLSDATLPMVRSPKFLVTPAKSESKVDQPCSKDNPPERTSPSCAPLCLPSHMADSSRAELQHSLETPPEPCVLKLSSSSRSSSPINSLVGGSPTCNPPEGESQLSGRLQPFVSSEQHDRRYEYPNTQHFQPPQAFSPPYHQNAESDLCRDEAQRNVKEDKTTTALMATALPSLPSFSQSTGQPLSHTSFVHDENTGISRDIFSIGSTTGTLSDPLWPDQKRSWVEHVQGSQLPTPVLQDGCHSTARADADQQTFVKTEPSKVSVVFAANKNKPSHEAGNMAHVSDGTVRGVQIADSAQPNNVYEKGYEPGLGFNQVSSAQESRPATSVQPPSWAVFLSNMTQQEQAHEDEQAAEQAEGSIIVDHNELESDAGYESDSVSTATTSLGSTLRDYAFENGRRYHKFREGQYNFPNDDVEQEREDLKHTMVKMLCQALHFAPIGDYPQQILDVGTGTGIWAIEMGDDYPSASVLGIDLSPIQPLWVPPNVKFVVDDVESPWLYPRNYFDYIHSRHTIMAIKEWPQLLSRALEHLKPGGWMELQEVHHRPYSADGSMADNHPVAQYWRCISQGLRNRGIDFEASADGKLGELMRNAGFVNVTERVFHIPIGVWPQNKVLKNVGLYWRTILLDGIQAIALGPMTRGLGWSREQVELFLVSVRRAYYDNAAHMYMPLHIVYGQKPGRRTR